MKLSEHFTLEEALHSDRAVENKIDNTDGYAEVLGNMKVTAAYMEVVRSVLGDKPITVSSFYRSLALNRLLKSKDTSQHRTGEAVDFICPAFGSPVQIVKAIISSKVIPFDQLILEHSWVHISFAVTSSAPRRQVLSLLESGNYATGITDKKGNPL